MSNHIASLTERPARFYSFDEAERLGFGPLFRAAEEYAMLGGGDFADGVNSPFPSHRTFASLHWVWVSGTKSGKSMRRTEERVDALSLPAYIEGETVNPLDGIEDKS